MNSQNEPLVGIFLENIPNFHQTEMNLLCC